MTERIVDFLDALVATVGAIDERYCLVEKREMPYNGETTNIPYKYVGNGNYRPVEVDGGSVSYWRLVNNISFDVVDGNSAIKNLQATYPIRYVAMVKRDTNNPLVFSQDVANVLEGRNKDLQTQLQAKNVNITVGSIDTDTPKIWSEEFTMPLKEPDYKRSLVMLDITVTVIAKRECWQDCDNYPDILQGFAWCEDTAATVDRLTDEQKQCLANELCGDPDPVTEQVNGVTIGTAASGTINNQVIENTDGTPVGTSANPSVVPDATVQLNSVTVGTIPSGDTDSFTVNLDGTPSGTWDGTAWQVTSAPCADATVQLNGVDMTDIPSGDTENILVLQSNDMTQVGSKQGTHWRIDDSAISINGSPIADVKAEDSLDIDVIQDGLPVGSWNGSEWVVPSCPALPTLSIGVFSDAGATIPITSALFGTAIYIKSTASTTQANYTLFIDNGVDSILPITAIDASASHIFEYTIDLSGTLNIYVIASDNTNGIADSEPFTFTVTGVYPPSITGNVLWIDAALAPTYVLNGSFVQQLNDLSGLSNHLSAPTVGNQPTYLDVPTGINGLRSSQFSSGKYLQKLGLSLDIVTGNSSWIVCKFNSAVTGGILSNANNPADGTPYFFLQQNGLFVRTFSAATGYSASYPIVLGTNYLFEVHRTPTQERFYINGVLQHTITVGVTGNRTNFYLNSSFGGNSTMTSGDVAVYNTVMSGTDEAALRLYLMTKWNIV